MNEELPEYVYLEYNSKWLSTCESTCEWALYRLEEISNRYFLEILNADSSWSPSMASTNINSNIRDYNGIRLTKEEFIDKLSELGVYEEWFASKL